MLGIEIEPFDEYDHESIILNFWMHSVTNRMNEFDFAVAFRSLREPMYRKLAEHGCMGYEAFSEYTEELICGCYSSDVFAPFMVCTDYIYITEDDVKEAIMHMQYDKYKNEFEGYGSFDELQSIYNDMDDWHGHTLQWKVELFDRAIHAQHETGDIFDDCDIESLRDEAEEEINELLGIEI